MSEPHWGSRSLRGGLYVVLAAVALMAALIAIFHWSPWERPTEFEWLQSYETWSEGTEATLGVAVPRASCESSYDDGVGDPPTERFDGVGRAARQGCTTLSPEGWQRAQSDVLRAIRDVHAAEAPPRLQPDFSELAGAVAGREAKVYCWSDAGWANFLQHYAMVRSDEEISLRGAVDVAESRIDLDPRACVGLRNYVQRYRPPAISTENLDMAEALVALMHQAEHLASPSTSELEIECYAAQHLRPLIRAAGWAPGYQTEIARLFWELRYTQMPAHLQAPECRNDGQLDRHPGSDAWP